jgi:hypothetical protein
MLTLALVVVFCTCALGSAQAPPASAPAGSELLRFPSFGISFPTPEGYVRAPDSAQTVAVFFPQGQIGRRPDRAIMISLMPRRGKKFEEVVDETAEQSKMRVLDRKSDWGGLNATELIAADAEAQPPGLPRTLRTVLVEREGWVFAINYCADPPFAGALRAFQAVVKGTKWINIERAGAGLSRREPDALVANGLSINIPDPFRPDPEADKRSAIFIARDLPTRVAVARIVVLPLPRKDKVQSMQDLKAQIDRQFVPIWKAKGRFAWDDQPGAISASLSSRVETAEGTMRALLILAQDGTPTIVSLHCRKTEDAIKGFERALLIVRASIRPAGAAASTQAATQPAN